MKFFSYLVGLAIAMIGLANVMPTYDVLPRIGPFDLSIFRPGIYFLCALAVVLILWQKEATILGKAILSLVVAITSFACWDSYLVGVELEESVFFFSSREMWIAVSVLISAIYLSYRLWGIPIAALGTISILYLTTGAYWPGIFKTGGGNLAELIASNYWYSIDQGILGSILGVVSTTVLPFIILGALLEGVGAGESMIRIAFYYMRRFRGGPAYAAVTSSALFGTVSGSAVANVVGTGVVTIPMIRKRGFSREFSGGVEAAASTGGQILPPIMGAAALIMADIVGVSYVTVMSAALIPALAYYASLFLAIGFEAQRLGVTAEIDEQVEPPSNQDWINMTLVFIPLFIIVALLIYGMSPAGASISAILLLIPLSFLNPKIRRTPKKILTSFSNGGNTVARLVSVTAIVGVVVATLAATGLPSKLSVLLIDAASSSLFLALAISAAGCVVLGMGMPTLPAYIAIISVMGSTFQGLGIELLLAHLFVFTYGVASVITPPVAIASYAAAAISEGKPISTAVQSSRIGAMIFLIPFAFIYNPELSLGAGTGDYNVVDLLISLPALVGAMYLISSALIGFDKVELNYSERLLSSVVGLSLIFASGVGQFFAAVIGGLVIYRRWVLGKRLVQQVESVS